jgi:hypothetical protein
MLIYLALRYWAIITVGPTNLQGSPGPRRFRDYRTDVEFRALEHPALPDLAATAASSLTDSADANSTGFLPT